MQKLHPDLINKSPEQLRTTIPIVVHEDAAPFQKKKSVKVLQWGPLFINGSDLESRFVHHGYIDKHGDPAESARRAWDKFWEEVEYMAEGHDRLHQPIAKDGDGTIWKFIFMFCENDLDIDSEHGLPNNSRSVLFCKHCLATNIMKEVQLNPHPYNDNG